MIFTRVVAFLYKERILKNVGVMWRQSIIKYTGCPISAYSITYDKYDWL